MLDEDRVQLRDGDESWRGDLDPHRSSAAIQIDVDSLSFMSRRYSCVSSKHAVFRDMMFVLGIDDFRPTLFDEYSGELRARDRFLTLPTHFRD